MKNSLEFKVYGKYALFTDPITRVGGEKFTYQLPTYQALKGICESIYWKPTIIWIIDEVRIMHPIRTQSQGIRPINYSGGNTLSYYTYLVDVEYQVKAHFIWNETRLDLIHDRNENKHYFVAKRMLERGGRRDIFLGTRECQGYVEPVRFGDDESFYDKYGTLQFENMFYGYDYPSDSGEEKLVAKFWRPIMKDGVITFSNRANLSYRNVKSMSFEKLATSGLTEAGLLDGYDEGGKCELDTETV